MMSQRISEESPKAKKKKFIETLAETTARTTDDFTDYEPVCDLLDEDDSFSQKAEASRMLGATIRATLLEISEIQERNRDRRHKELLAVLSKIFSNDSQIKDASLPNTENIKQQRYELAEFLTDAQISSESVAYGKISTLKVKTAEIEGSKTNSFERSTVSMQHQHSNILKPALGGIPENGNNSPKLIAPKNKSELQLMRAKMLEAQRQKMKDRERKKLEHLQMLNSQI